MQRQQTHHVYWLMLPLLLIFVGLVMRFIDINGLWYDESFTVMNAGGASFAPISLEAIYGQIVKNDPYQAPGYPWFVAVWGRTVGWSELALRWSSALFTLLAMALTFRIGREHLSARVGLFAALTMGFSYMTIFYAHELRAFTLIPLCVALLLWGYSRWLRGDDSRLTQAGIFIGALSLLYAHYFGGLILIAMALYHLLFVPKNRRWWRPLFLMMGVALCFLPVIPMFIEGLTIYTPDGVPDEPYTVPAALEALLYNFGNDALLLTAIVLLAGVGYAIRERGILAMWLIVGLFSLVILLVSNVFLGNLTPSRIRYAMILWVFFALWAGAGMAFIDQQAAQLLKNSPLQRPVSLLLLIGIPTLWLLHGVQVQVTPGFGAAYKNDDIPRTRTMTELLREYGNSDDLLVFYHGRAIQSWYMQSTMDYATYNIPMPWLFASTRFDDEADVRDWSTKQIEAAPRIWYGINHFIELHEVHQQFAALLEEDFVYCDTYLENAELTLELHAISEAYCETDDEQLVFGDEQFILRATDVQQVDNQLQVYTHWSQADSVPRQTYNIAFHLVEPGVIMPVTQADVAPGFDPSTPVAATLELEGVPPGAYELWILVYEWQGGTRLIGENVSTGQSGDRVYLMDIVIE